MPNPFDLSEEDKVAILLARVLYLKNCIYKGEKPNPSTLHTGSAVYKNTAYTCINLLGYPDDALDALLAEAELLYESAVKSTDSDKESAA